MVIPSPWSPGSDAALARWVTRAAAGSGEPDGELLAHLLPRRGDALRLEAACAVLDALAVAQAAPAARLAAALAGCAAHWRLASGRARQEWVAELAAGQAPLRLLLADPVLQALGGADGWRLAGAGHCFGPADGPLLVFAEAGAGRTRRLLPLLTVPGGVVPACAAAWQRPAWQPVPLHGAPAHPVPLGNAGAPAALALGLAVQRVAGAALLLGVAADAFAQACAADAAAGNTSAQALAGAAASLSAARLLLREAARAAQAGEGDAALPLLALRAAAECAERLVGLAVPLAGGDPAADPARLQALLVARRLHQGFAAPPSTPIPAPHAARLTEETDRTMAKLSAMSPAAAAAAARAEPAGDRVSAILDAAADAFTQQSYDATSLDAIGDAIGVTKGSIYHHYRSKADLFVAVYRRTMEMNIATVEPIARQSGVRPIERLYRMAHAHALQVMKHLSYQRLAVQGTESHLMNRVNEEQRAQLAEVVRLRDRYEELFLGAIEAAVEAGELPRQDARLAVKPVFGAINWTTMWYQPRPGETAADRARIADQLATFVVSGLGRAYQPAPAEGAAQAEPEAAR